MRLEKLEVHVRKGDYYPLPLCLDTLVIESCVFVCLFQIRVVNAFRHGMDSQQLQQATSNPNIQRVLQKQASLSGKRFSVAAGQTMLAVQPPPCGSASLAPETNANPSLGVASTVIAGVSSTPGVPPAGQGSHCTSNTRITIPEQSFSHTETAV